MKKWLPILLVLLAASCARKNEGKVPAELVGTWVVDNERTIGTNTSQRRFTAAFTLVVTSDELRMLILQPELGIADTNIMACTAVPSDPTRATFEAPPRDDEAWTLQASIL
jgi:hypothetical protein